jgi:hypothetical protein
VQYDLNQSAKHQREHREAVEAGFAKLGFTHPNLLVCWGWRNGRRWHAAGRDVLVLERGYIGDRFRFSSVALNGLNGRATFPAAVQDGGARFRSFGVPLQPWNPDGEYVLLIGQVAGDAALQGKNLGPWYVSTAKQAEAIYGLPVHFRQHPREADRRIVRKVPGTVANSGDLGDALAGAAVVVTFNSNTGVDAMLAGKPTVTADPGAMAWPVAAHDLGEPASPDRQAWAYDLAWKQWGIEEIASGEALRGIAEVLNAGDHQSPRGRRIEAQARTFTRATWPKRRAPRPAQRG